MLQQLIVVVIQQQLQVSLLLVEVEKLNVLPAVKKVQRAPPGNLLVMDSQPRKVFKSVFSLALVRYPILISWSDERHFEIYKGKT